MPERTVQAYAVALSDLAQKVERLGGMAETALSISVTSLTRRNSALAQDAIARDIKIDALHREIERDAVNLLALHQPVAADLRHVISSWRIASEIARIGELARNIARRVLILNEGAPAPLVGSVERMAKIVMANLKQVLDAYTNRDTFSAMAVWMWDEDVDSHFNALFRELLTYMMDDPRLITPCAHLLIIAKNLERVGDHATNIAERLHYLVTGEDISGERPKISSTSDD